MNGLFREVLILLEMAKYAINGTYQGQPVNNEGARILIGITLILIFIGPFLVTGIQYKKLGVGRGILTGLALVTLQIVVFVVITEISFNLLNWKAWLIGLIGLVLLARLGLGASPAHDSLGWYIGYQIIITIFLLWSAQAAAVGNLVVALHNMLMFLWQAVTF